MDADQFDFENQCGAGRDAWLGDFAVAEFRRDIYFPFVAYAHLLQCYDPAFYQLAHTYRKRAAAQAGVKALAVYRPAQVMADDNVRHPRLSPRLRAGLKDFVENSLFEGIDTVLLGFGLKPLGVFLEIFLFIIIRFCPGKRSFLRTID